MKTNKIIVYFDVVSRIKRLMKLVVRVSKFLPSIFLNR